MKGRVFSERYEILEEVGQGGMATVYKAEDRRMDRFVAIKVLHPYLSRNEKARERFRREAQVVAKLRHKNIVQIFDFSGINSEEAFIVTEFIEGENLRDFFESKSGCFLPEIAALVIQTIALALDHAHSKGIIHRDVKPENVMIRSDGVLKLMDFGIAQVLDAQQMTATGTMVGSPAFMSPEHIEGSSLDHRADIFSLGTIAYQLVVGELPFQGDNPHALLRNIMETRYVPVMRKNPAVSRELALVVETCLKKDREQRYSSCQELASDLVRACLPYNIGKADDELPRFFKSPASYSVALRQTLVEKEISEGKRFAREGRVALAMARLSRAMALDETRVDVVELVNKLQQRQLLTQRLLMGAKVLGAGLFMVASILGGLWSLGIFSGEAPDIPLAKLSASVEESRDVPPPGEKESRPKGPNPDLAATTGPREQEPRTEGPIPPEGPAEDEQSPGSPRTAPVTEPPRPLWSYKPLAESAARDLEQRYSLLKVSFHDRALAMARTPLPAALPVGEQDTSTAEVKLTGDKVDRSGEIVHRRRNGNQEGAREGSKIKEGEGNTDSKKIQLQEVTVEAFPPAVEIWIDGQMIGSGKGKTELEPGRHKLRLHHPSCDFCSDMTKFFMVESDRPSPRLKERIRFKPALLIVHSRKEGLVFVKDKPMGRTGRVLDIPFESHRPEKFDIKVLFDDKSAPYEGVQVLRPGMRSSINL